MLNRAASIANRFRNVIVGAGMSLVARGLTAACSLITIPTLLAEYGKREYGVWAFVMSLQNLLSFMDFGVGNALLNESASLVERGERSELHAFVASCVWGFFAVAVLASVGIVLAGEHFAIAAWLGVGGANEQVALQAFTIYSLLSVPLAAVQRLQTGIGKSYRNGVTQSALSLAGLGVILVGAQLHAQLVPLMVTYALSQWLISAVSVCHFLIAECISIHPRTASLRHVVFLLKRGAPFLLLQLCAISNAYMDNVLVARLMSVEAVAVISVVARIFQLIGLPVAMINVYLWPMYTRALARRDAAFIEKTWHRSLVLTFVSILVAGVAVTVAFPTITRVWIRRDDFDVSLALLLSMTLWTMIAALGNASATVLNAMSLLRLQIVVAPLTASIILVGKVLLLERFGLAALPFVAAVGYLFATAIPLSVQVQRAVRSVRSTASQLTVVNLAASGESRVVSAEGARATRS